MGNPSSTRFQTSWIRVELVDDTWFNCRLFVSPIRNLIQRINWFMSQASDLEGDSTCVLT